MFPTLGEVKKLSRMSRTAGFHWGAHYPLIRKDRPTRDSLFLSPDRAEQEAAFADFEKEASLVSRFGGKYLLAHFPKPTWRMT